MDGRTDKLHEVLQVAACTYISSSVCEIALAVLSWKRTHCWIVVVLCIVSISTGVMEPFALLMGMFAFWTIH